VTTRIGIDFDNTLVCYDPLFHRLAVARGLIPTEVPPTKGEIRGFLRRAGREADWTALQGEVYGEQILEAEPFPGALEFLRGCGHLGLTPYVISHKTRFPFLGRHHDLHAAGHRWLAAHGFYDASRGTLTPDRVYFELTKEAKLTRIAVLRCDAFIDDLPELLADPGFPAGVRRILFDPNGIPAGDQVDVRAGSWPEVEALLA
jgi:hypothetical protein